MLSVGKSKELKRARAQDGLQRTIGGANQQLLRPPEECGGEVNVRWALFHAQRPHVLWNREGSSKDHLMVLVMSDRDEGLLKERYAREVFAFSDGVRTG